MANEKIKRTINVDETGAYVATGCAAGVATEAKQDAANALLTTIDADTSKIPASPSTSGKQDDQTALLTTIDADTGAILAKIIAAPATAALQLPDGHNVTIDNTATSAVPVSGAFYPAIQSVQVVNAVLSPVPVSGTVTANAGTNLNTSALATSAAQLPDGHAVTVDNASLPVTAAALPLPAGAATAAAQTDGSQLAQLVGAAGVPVQVVDDKLRTISMPYDYAIMEGLIAGHSQFGSFGARENVLEVAQGSDLWNGAATTQPYPVDAGEQLIIVSTSAEDDPDKGGATPGTGIHTLHLHYLDAAGAPQTEDIELDGTTPVTLTETNVRFVQLMHTLTAGTTGAAVGTITLYKSGAAATVYGHIAIGTNKTLSPMMMVPAGKTLYITQGFASAADKSVDIRLRATAVAGELIPNVFIAQGVGSLRDTAIVRSPRIKIPSLAIVKMTCYVPATKAGADVSGGWSGWIE